MAMTNEITEKALLAAGYQPEHARTFPAIYEGALSAREEATKKPTRRTREAHDPPRTNASARSGRTKLDRTRSKAIRDWAAAQNIRLSGKGRIPDKVVQQYDIAHQPPRRRRAAKPPAAKFVSPE